MVTVMVSVVEKDVVFRRYRFTWWFFRNFSIFPHCFSTLSVYLSLSICFYPCFARYIISFAQLCAQIVAGVPFGESWLRDSLHTHTAMLFNLCSKFVSLRDAAVATPAPTADPAGKPPTGAPAPPPQPKIMTVCTEESEKPWSFLAVCATF